MCPKLTVVLETVGRCNGGEYCQVADNNLAEENWLVVLFKTVVASGSGLPKFELHLTLSDHHDHVHSPNDHRSLCEKEAAV